MVRNGTGRYGAERGGAERNGAAEQGGTERNRAVRSGTEPYGAERSATERNGALVLRSVFRTDLLQEIREVACMLKVLLMLSLIWTLV